jgi:undecaprenyl diphosphate synthase
MNPINHVAIIMDGNGRWGLKHKKSRNAGHKAGLKNIEAIIDESARYKIKHLTLYTFSTENWKRPKNEVDFLFNLLSNFLSKKIEHLVKKKIRVKFIGEIQKLPISLKKLIRISEKKTAKNFKIEINIALNYGSKIEILNTFKLLLKKKIFLNENNIEENLYTKNIPHPDILIRTGNTKRLSNFLLWQLAYTEIFFEKKLWPDFKVSDYSNILKKFKKLKRNFGAI